MSARVALFFTEGVSLDVWREAGLIERDTLLYERLCALGYEVTFVTYGDARDHQNLPDTSQIKVVSQPQHTRHSSFGRRIPLIHRKALAAVDLIKSHQVQGARYAALAKMLLRKPYIARCGYLLSVFANSEQRSWRSRLGAYLEECIAFHLADAVCVPGPGERDYIRRKYRINPNKIHICPNWIDTERFRPKPRIRKRPRRVCFVARFAPEKQPLLLLEALRSMKDIELLMIGGGPLREEIDARIKEYGMSATVLDRLNNEALPDYLNTSSVFVLPTTHEGGSPKTLLEAMSCGLPVVSTNAFGVDDAFEHGRHGYKCDPHDVGAFREAIELLLADPGLSRKLGAQGREWVVAHYSIDQAVERELALYQKLLKGRRKHDHRKRRDSVATDTAASVS